MNLENQIRLAREAAKSDFLWGLGMRMPSANQARKICQTLSVSLADEKRVKAVMRLREDDPQALLEIRDSAADEGEKVMVETINGPKHFETLSKEKDTEIWQRIFERCGISMREGITHKPPFAGVRSYVSSGAATRGLTEVYAYTNIGKIEIWPAPGSNSPSRINIHPDKRYNFFYIPKQGGGTVNSWAHAVLSVTNKDSLLLAQKLARAYESETARRRKPAKAIVLKNY